MQTEMEPVEEPAQMGGAGEAKGRSTRLVRVGASAHDYLASVAVARGISVGALISEAVALMQDERRGIRTAEVLGRRFDEGREALSQALGSSLGNLAGRVAALDADINVLSAQLSELCKLVAFTSPEPVDGVLANLAGRRRLAAMEREILSGLVREGGRVVSKTVASVAAKVDAQDQEGEV